MRVTVRLFGAFKKYGDEAHIDLPDGGSINVADVRRSLRQWMESRDDGSGVFHLLDDSVFANDSQVLDDSMAVAGAYIAILPPVCGG